MMRLISHNGRVEGLRAVLLVLVVIGLIGTAGELALERHWHGKIQLLPWVALGGVCIGLVGLFVRTSPVTIWLARALRPWQSAWPCWDMAALGRKLRLCTAGLPVHRHMGDNDES